MRAHSRQAASGKSVGTHLEQGHQRRASRLGNPCDVRHAKRGEVVERAVASSSRVCGSSSNTVVGRRLRTPSLNTDDTHLVAPTPPPAHPRSSHGNSPRFQRRLRRRRAPTLSRRENRESRVSSIAKRGRARLTGRAAGAQRPADDAAPIVHRYRPHRRPAGRCKRKDNGGRKDDVSPPRRRVTTPTTTPGSGKSKRTIVDENQRALRARPPM